jgi:tRNA nucleotidyltransferase (CCA-adding enzyme)
MNSDSETVLAPIAPAIAWPITSIGPAVTIGQARQILKPEDDGLSVMEAEGKFIGLILRRDLELASHYGFDTAPVRDHLSPLRSVNQRDLVVPAPDADVRLGQLRQWLKPELWQLLTIAADLATAQGWQLYLVGGAVRDLFLALSRQDLAQADLLLQDIDLVVDRRDRSAEVGAGVELARSLQAAYPQARLEIHPKFQTAAVVWQNDPALQNLGVDIATARTEFYPYPAANPIVEASSIRQDLYRRDFTINALAIRLTLPQPGELLDFFGGVQDLQQQQIRVLHANSVIEDPTRIFRAVRFAARLGFQLEPQTAGYIRSAIASGLYDRIHDRIHHERLVAPALQTRLRSELKYLLQSSYWQSGLRQLGDLQALQCIHPRLSLNRELGRQLHRAGRVEGRLGGRGAGGQERGLLVLETLLAGLEPDDRPIAAADLQLPPDSRDRLQALGPAEAEMSQRLPNCLLPSQRVAWLDRYPKPLLVLMGLRGDQATRRILWCYLTDWSLRPTLLKGKDLQALGYRPGQPFKQILAALRVAQLDGQISDRAAAIALVQQKFPQE